VWIVSGALGWMETGFSGGGGLGGIGSVTSIREWGMLLSAVLRPCVVGGEIHALHWIMLS